MTPDTTLFTADDHAHMAHALRLAERGLYTTAPNPRVGCVIVKHGLVIGSGWHERAGEPHAEIHALRAAGEQTRGATAYVTLEPCSHVGRTPPCADALISAGIIRVIAAMTDPNPQVAGQGLTRLAAAGVAVSMGLMADEARALNPGFVQRMTLQRPWIRIKTAASLDGRTALANGQSQWITGNDARMDVHRWRARSCAILTGIGTVLADDPQLNVRHLDTQRQPFKIIVDTHLRTPVTAHILQSTHTLIAHAATHPERCQPLLDAGATLIQVPLCNQQLDLSYLMTQLAQHGINEVLTEAGARLNGALIAAGLANQWIAYIAPIVMGASARGLFNLPCLDQLSAAPKLTITECLRIGNDWRMLADFV